MGTFRLTAAPFALLCGRSSSQKSTSSLFFFSRGAFLFRIIIAIKAGRDVDDAGCIVASRHFGGGSIARRKKLRRRRRTCKQPRNCSRKRRRKVIERLGTGVHEREFRCRGYFREQLFHFRAGSET